MRARARELFNAVGDFGNSLKAGMKAAARELAIQGAFALATEGVGPIIGTGLRTASPALRGLFAEGSVAGKSIIGIRTRLLEGGFTQSLSEKGMGYLFKNGAGEEVRIMRRASSWDLRIRNAVGKHLDEFGNVAHPSKAHGINITDR